MEKTIGITKAREEFSELVNHVAFGGERYVVERRGKPLAIMINAAEYQQLLQLLADSGVSSEIHGIQVRIRYDGERYFITDDTLDLYGVGSTLTEARHDYWLAVQDYYTDLVTHADSLAKHMQEHLILLRQLFTPNEQME
jgi:prevent-host-death family protein